MARVIFIPWTRDEAAKSIVDRWSQWKEAKAFDVFCFGDGALPQRLGSLGTKDDSVYIRGHGMAGSDYISPDPEDKDASKRLRFDVVCERLRTSGLKETFGGAIKFYNCDSAFPGEPLQPHAVAFGKEAASYLRGKGFNRCRIFGYVGDLSSDYQEEEPSRPEYLRALREHRDASSFEPQSFPKQHKFSTVEFGDPRAPSSIVRRAKEARIEFP